MRDFRNYKAWRKARALNLQIYRVTSKFPYEERFGLTAQLRRASVSVASNLAEGGGRVSDADFRRFVAMALGSAAEVECQLILASDLDLVDRVDLEATTDLVHEVRRLLVGLHRTLARTSGR